MRSFAALRVGAFRHIAAAYTVNELGNWIGDVALAILVFSHTGSALATAALFIALRAAPALLAPPLTTRVEVGSPRRVLPALYVAEAIIFIAIIFVARSFSLAAVLALAALDGVLAVASRALIRSVNARVLAPRKLLREGNAVINLGVSVGGAVGPALGGALVAAAGVAAALWVDAGTFFAVAVIMFTARELEAAGEAAAGALERLRAGVGEAWRNPVIRRLLLTTAVGLMFGAAGVPVEVVFAKRTLHAGDAGYGLLMTAWGGGMIAGGAAFAGTLRLRNSLLIPAGMAFVAIGYGGLAVSPDLGVACFFSAVGGVGNGLWWVAIVTGLQQTISQQSQAAALAVLEGINQVMPALGFVLGGVLAATASTRLAYAVAAVGAGLVFLAQMVPPVMLVDPTSSSSESS